MSNIFKQTHVFLGEIERKSQNNTIKWEFSDENSKSLISSVEPGCGCTGALLTNDGVIASFNEQDTENWTDEVLNQNKAVYPNGYVSDKMITVYLNDGEERYIKAENGSNTSNPKKSRIVLTFSTYVKL